MGRFNDGQNPNGIWQLWIEDVKPASNNHARLNSWSLEFGSNPARPYHIPDSHLPMVRIETQQAIIPDEPKISGWMEIVNNRNGQINQLSDLATDYSGWIGIEVRGNSSQSFPKLGYGIETRDDEGENNNVSLLQMPKENDWVLMPNYTDKSLIRNVLTYTLYKNMGYYAPRMHFCNLYLNGGYRGIYVLGEKIKWDKNRVNISKLNLRR